MMIKLEIDSPLGRWQDDAFNPLGPWDLIYFSNVLGDLFSAQYKSLMSQTYLANKSIKESLPVPMTMMSYSSFFASSTVSVKKLLWKLFSRDVADTS